MKQIGLLMLAVFICLFFSLVVVATSEVEAIDIDADDVVTLEKLPERTPSKSETQEKSLAKSLKPDNLKLMSESELENETSKMTIQIKDESLYKENASESLSEKELLDLIDEPYQPEINTLPKIEPNNKVNSFNSTRFETLEYKMDRLKPTVIPNAKP